MENDSFLWKYELVNAGFIYDTEIIDFVKKKNLTYILKESPFYKLDYTLKRANINFRLTDEEKEEKEKIKDVVYFAEKYCRMEGNESRLGGYPKLELFDFQKEMLRELSNNRLVSVMTSRQMGKEWVTAIYILHYLITNTDRSVVVSSIHNSGNLVDKVKHLYRTLPFFLKPGLKNWNQKSVVFDNGCRIYFMKITKEPAIGFTINCLVVQDILSGDEKTMSKWLDAVFPTISAIRNSQIFVLHSGMEKYDTKLYKTFFESQDTNFKHLVYHYSLMPHTDEKWKDTIISMIGLDSFRREYELEKIDIIKEIMEEINKNKDGLQGI